jgi:hypothetical protein
MATVKPIPVHKDIFGRPINEGSYVAFPHANTLYIGTVGKCSPKMVRVHPVKGYRAEQGMLKYAHECVTVEGADVTFYILKHS